MPTKTLKMSDLLSVSSRIDYDVTGTKVRVLWQVSDTERVRIELDAASVAALNQKKQQIQAFLDSTVTLTGIVVERWMKGIRTEGEVVQIEDWILQV